MYLSGVGDIYMHINLSINSIRRKLCGAARQSSTYIVLIHWIRFDKIALSDGSAQKIMMWCYTTARPGYNIAEQHEGITAAQYIMFNCSLMHDDPIFFIRKIIKIEILKILKILQIST